MELELLRKFVEVQCAELLRGNQRQKVLSSSGPGARSILNR